MSDNESTHLAVKTTFWKLIKEKTVKFPNYQREYAQGRENRRAELVRRNFLEPMLDALKQSDPKELDFVFGGGEGDDKAFSPVDGQQRLTFLFLLHWYCFARADYKNDLETLKNFTYSTRTSSEHFCKNLCDSGLVISFTDNAPVSAEIKNVPWFTGAMESDPTVRSMLKVIDLIHDRLAQSVWTELAERLKSDVNDCPITFFSLDMKKALGKGTGILDLYIKMNARGVELTDFELFKAELQKEEKDNQRFDLLASYFRKIGKKDTPEERVKLIGKFNNEYTNFFFRLIDNGEIIYPKDEGTQMFDTAMMNFINETIRMHYFCQVSESGIPQKTYRGDNDTVKRMSGQEFTAFIKDCDEGKYLYATDKKGGVSKDAAREALKEAFGNTVRLLDLFCESNDLSAFSVGHGEHCGFDLKERIKALAVDSESDKKALPMRDSLSRMALYAFLLKFGLPGTNGQKEACRVWNRFVWKVDRNTDFRNFDEAVETLRAYRRILEDCPGCAANDVLNAISGIKMEEKDGSVEVTDPQFVVGKPTKNQFYEEKRKAELAKASPEWKAALEEAEDVFSENGEIWFLLDLCKTESGEYDLKRFRDAKAIAEALLDPKKKVKAEYLRTFDQALLAWTKTGPLQAYRGKDHMLPMGTSNNVLQTRRFSRQEDSSGLACPLGTEDRELDRYQIMRGLLQEMLDQKRNGFWQGVEAFLTSYLEAYRDKETPSADWKDILIRYDLLDKTPDGDDRNAFKAFEPNVWGNTCTAAYRTAQRRTDSGELCSFALACALHEKPGDRYTIEYQFSDEDKYADDHGFPVRFCTVTRKEDGARAEIGFTGNGFVRRMNGKPEKIGTFEEVMKDPDRVF